MTAKSKPAELSRDDKIRIIRRCFKRQPWDRDEVIRYLIIIGIEPKPTEQLSDEEIDQIFADLEKAKMI